jgi:NADH-quinone oxidoreductase subunit G
VVFPVAAVAEKAGTFVNWEGRGGSFGAALRVPEVRTDLYVLGAIADQMDVHLGLPDALAARAEMAALGTWRGERPEPPAVSGVTGAEPQYQPDGTFRLATWHQLLDDGRLQDGEPSLAGTARPVVARMSAATAAEAGIAAGDKVTVATGRGSVTVPVEVVPMTDRVVWLPAGGLPQAARKEGDAALPAAGVPYPGAPREEGFVTHASWTVRSQLGAGHGAVVTLRRPE